MKMSRSLVLAVALLRATLAADFRPADEQPAARPKNPMAAALHTRVFHVEKGHLPTVPPFSTVPPPSSPPPVRLPAVPPLDLSRVPGLGDVPLQLPPFDVEELERLGEITGQIAQMVELLVQNAHRSGHRSAASRSLDDDEIDRLERADRPPSRPAAAERPPGRGDALTTGEWAARWLVLGGLLFFALLCCGFAWAIGRKAEAVRRRRVRVIPLRSPPSTRETSADLISI
ncbi:hypothetical protein M3Y99_00821500 [Aphelenchoides fujianensis]|nr:hypothetical protein M3Y99_00821500 [Aphelenchoides fujianensis]